MPETPSTGFSRMCPSCGRKVPRAVMTCRCGATLPEEAGLDATFEAEEAEEAEPASGLPKTLVVVVAALAALAVGGYWFMRPAPLPDEAATAESAAEGPASVPDGLARPATDPAIAAFPSAAQRAWQLAVGLKDAPAPSPASGASINAPPPSTPASSLEDVISRAMPAVVLIETPAGRGSGFYVRPDTLLTNVHVVENNSTVTVKRFDGASVTARVEARSQAFDIAVLKVSNPSPNQVTIPLGTTAAIRQGQDVIIIGTPLGTLQNTVTRGIVSGLRDTGTAKLVQTDASANPGNSGGPLLDRTGTAIGILTMGYKDSQGLNFAVAIDHARELIEGRVPAPSLTPSSTEYRNLSPAIESDADHARTQAQRAYEGTLDDLARAAAGFDEEWKRFRDQCYSGKVTGTFAHEWFALLVNGAISGPIATQCGSYLTGLRTQAESFREVMKTANEAVRRAGVYPGTIRDVNRSRQLEFDGWDR